MALQPPTAVDNQEVQFKLQNKHVIFPEGELHNHVSLLSVSSTEALLFAGNPNAAELKVFILMNLVEADVIGKKPIARTVPLPGVPHSLACSADGHSLAIHYTINGSSMLQIYSVSSFSTKSIKSLYTVRLSSEQNVSALQLLWNPVLTNMLAVVLSNGCLVIYTLKEGGQIELHSLDKSQNVQCGCWSPKGKQIVLGFPNGKLQQFKPDLTPAKSIVCPPQVHATPFKTIAVHWISTYQFAAVFLQQAEEANPSLYIVNAPKAGQPTYVSYDDICYSGSGPRAHQFTFTHISQWNLLLVCSANGVEVGVLATKESGDTPQWLQYLLLDDTRVELPLTKSKEETYPIGFCCSTAATHQLMLGEQQLPVMPMIHVLSTHGQLVSFNFLNLIQNAPDICSLPNAFIDESSEYYEITSVDNLPTSNTTKPTTPLPQVASTPAPNSTLSFPATTPALTSTPATKDKPIGFFGGPPTGGFFSQPPTSVAPAATNTAPLSFGGKSNDTAIKSSAPPGFTGFGLGNNSTTTTSTPELGGFTLSKSTKNVGGTAMAALTEKSQDLDKPLYTVPPNFVPPSTTENVAKPKTDKAAIAKTQINGDEMNELVQQMIDVQIDSFSEEIKQMSKAFTVNINGNLDEVKQYTRRLNDLQEIIEEANDHEFEMDVQNLRHELSESYAMLAEFRSKLEQYHNPDITPLASMTNFEAIDRRQVAKLRSYLAGNTAQLQQAQLQIDTQWSNFQDIMRRNTKHKMHIPCLDGIYQRMTKLKDMLGRQRMRLNYIRSKLKQQGFYYKSPALESSTSSSDFSINSQSEVVGLDSLTDSILSLSISQAVQKNRSKLSPQKLNSIRHILQQRQNIKFIKPKRPDRVNLHSEVILETKLRSEQRNQRALRDSATASLDKMLQQQQQQQPQLQQQQLQQQNDKYKFNAGKEATPPGLAKPMATKATPNSLQMSSAANVAKPFNFGEQNYAFGKNLAPNTATTPTTMGSNNAETEKSAGGFASFGGNFNFSLPKGTTVSMAPQTASEGPVTPISFAAKVIGGDATKLTTSSSNAPSNFKPDLGKTGFAALTGAPATKPTTTAATTLANNMGGVLQDKKAQAPPIFGAAFVPKTGSGTPAFSFTGTTTTAKPVFSGFNATPLNGAGNTTIRKPDSAVAASAFSGFGKAIGELATLAATLSVTTTTTTTSAMGNNTLSLGTKTTTSAVTTDAIAPVASQEAPAIAADNLFSDLNICKPNVKEDASKPPANIFSSTSTIFGGTNSEAGAGLFSTPATTGGFGTISTTATTTETTNSTFSFTNALGSLAKSVASATIPSTVTTTAAIEPAQTTVTTTSTEPVKNTNEITTTTKKELSTPVSAINTVTSSSTSIFGDIAKPTTTASTVFGGLGSSPTNTATTFGAASPTLQTTSSNNTIATVTTTTTSSMFGNSGGFFNVTAATPFSTPGTTISSTGNIFSGATGVITTAATTPNVTTATATGIFGGATAATTTNTTAAASGTGLFASIPKPDQSVFGSPQNQSPPSGFFANAANVTSPTTQFGQTSSATGGGSIFGGNVGGGFGATSPGNVFGSIAATTTPSNLPFGGSAANQNAGSSIFGGGAAKVAEGGNLFGSGASVFAQTAGSPGFNSGASIFGGSSQNAGANSGSIFGGGSSGGFGAVSGGAFSTSPNAGHSFAQGGASVAQTGFGSPQAPSAFTKSVFGGPSSFGSPPAFGVQPSFGGGALFGKSFGSFGSPTAPVQQTNAFGTAAPKDNIFETLGSSDSALSFGNLAQNTNANAPPKPAFGGSMFMNYRA